MYSNFKKDKKDEEDGPGANPFANLEKTQVTTAFEGLKITCYWP